MPKTTAPTRIRTSQVRHQQEVEVSSGSSASLLSQYETGAISVVELWGGLQEPGAFHDYVADHGQAPTPKQLTRELDLSREDQVALVKHSRCVDKAELPTLNSRTPVGRLPAARGSVAAQGVRDFVEQVAAEQGATLTLGLPNWVLRNSNPAGQPGALAFYKRADLRLELGEAGVGAVAWPVRIHLRATVACPLSSGAIVRARAYLAKAFGQTAQDALQLKLQRTVALLLSEAKQHPADVFQALSLELRKVLTDGITAEQLDEQGFPRTLLTQRTTQALAKAEAERARVLLGLEDYPQAFALARSMARIVRFRVGPTNSGKTHDALEALKAAQSGLYLAPLRLLAMEIRDRLVAEGVPCNLVTGEEKIMMEGARHTACTVEMLSSEHPVEVAVLDEIQMLQDPGRGWAWTAALVGAPAKELYVCGDPSVLKLCLEVISNIGEEVETKELLRKTKLTVQSSALKGLRQVEPGDAIVVFSRKDALTLSARLRQQGLTVATLYGALAPEVRRAEAARFSTGKAQVVVSTDVIGMGLNLPIRRVVFSTAHKFDGEAVRPLTVGEARQIAGRAGRYGIYPEGFVTALDSADLALLRSILEAPLPSPLKRMPLAPNRWHVQQLSEMLRSEEIGDLLGFFTTRVAVKSPLFKTASMEDAIALGHVVDKVTPSMPLLEKYSFACAPVARDKEAELGYFVSSLRAHHAGRKMSLPGLPTWIESSGSEHLEEAEALSKILGLYAWLAFKFPETFFQHEQVTERRLAVCRYIERALLSQGGFGVTSKERFKQRRA